jgi:transmembrane sensor
MKKYHLFDIADFVMDEDFIRWVNQQCREDNAYWENWLGLHPHKHLVVAEARRILESIGAGEPVVPQPIVAEEVNRLLQAIGSGTSSASIPAPVRRASFGWKYAAAAGVVVCILCAVTLYNTRNRKDQLKFGYADITASRQLVENINTTKTSIIVALPDGSSVQLGVNSRISYENNFDSAATRDVYLSGQAFFTVKKKPEHPFRVFANEIVAKVLGTSFTIRSFEKDTVIQVTVNTGKVSVYSQGQTAAAESAIPNKLGGIIVTPNQQLVYGKLSQEFQKILLENPVMIAASPAHKSMAYEDSPLEKVFDDLSRDYGINILYDNELLKTCTVTADMLNESFYRKLDLICRAVGASYEVIDGQVVIQSAGCN